jgi:hypothetical protein
MYIIESHYLSSTQRTVHRPIIFGEIPRIVVGQWFAGRREIMDLAFSEIGELGLKAMEMREPLL